MNVSVHYFFNKINYTFLLGQLNPPSAPKPNGVVRRSQSFCLAFPTTKKDFRSSRAAGISSPNQDVTN